MIQELEAVRPKPHVSKSVFERHGVTQDILARYFKVSQPLVSKWLSGHKEIPEDVKGELERLAEKLKVEGESVGLEVR